MMVRMVAERMVVEVVVLVVLVRMLDQPGDIYRGAGEMVHRTARHRRVLLRPFPRWRSGATVQHGAPPLLRSHCTSLHTTAPHPLHLPPHHCTSAPHLHPCSRVVCRSEDGRGLGPAARPGQPAQVQQRARPAGHVMSCHGMPLFMPCHVMPVTSKSFAMAQCHARLKLSRHGNRFPQCTYQFLSQHLVQVVPCWHPNPWHAGCTLSHPPLPGTARSVRAPGSGPR